MSMKQDHKAASGADPFAQLSQGVERTVRKKKALNDDALPLSDSESVKQQGHEVAEPAQSKASAAAAAVLMSHWSEQKSPTAAPIDTLTTADRQRLADKRKVINDPKKGEKDGAAKADDPSKSQAHE